MSRPLIFGEVLFDVFPNGEEVLGGAPFNVAWHLAAFEADPLLVSCIGADNRGAQVRSSMRQWGMDQSGLSESPISPTGTVQVVLKKGEAHFEILSNQAYDDINVDPLLLDDGEKPALLYHGSLALRTPHAVKTLKKIASQVEVPIFVDLNIRKPWWNADSLTPLLQEATWLKLNSEELSQLSCTDLALEADRRAAAQIVLERFALDAVIVTKAHEPGFLLSSKDGCHPFQPPTVTHFVDSVGAGDAFSAVCILGLLKGWSTEYMLETAASFASTLCSQRGATSFEKDLYSLQDEECQKEECQKEE